LFKATFNWTIDPVQAMAKLATGIRNKALRIALNAGSAPVKAAVIASAPRGTGNLAQSTVIKVKSYRDGDNWVAIVGASSKFKRLKKRKRKPRKRDKNGKLIKAYVRPALYQRLVDRGTKHIHPRNYLPRAFNSAKMKFESVAKAKLKEVIEGMMTR
jgi:HK97 gp10 family phage protein